MRIAKIAAILVVFLFPLGLLWAAAPLAGGDPVKYQGIVAVINVFMFLLIWAGFGDRTSRTSGCVPLGPRAGTFCGRSAPPTSRGVRQADQDFFAFLGFFGLGSGRARAVISINSESHSPFSIWSSMRKLSLAPG